MKKLVGLFVLCVFGVVPSASARFVGGDGDGCLWPKADLSFRGFR